MSIAPAATARTGAALARQRAMTATRGSAALRNPRTRYPSFNTVRPLRSDLAWQSSAPRPFQPQKRWSTSALGSSQREVLTKYTFDDIRARLPTAGAPTVPDPSPSRLVLIDVREPAELEATGRIPTAHNLPISSLPDGLFLPPDEFRDKFGFEKPQAGSEVVFYCKSGIRSHTAAAMVAPEWSGQGIKVGEFPGSWIDWSERGGEAER